MARTFLFDSGKSGQLWEVNATAWNHLAPLCESAQTPCALVMAIRTSLYRISILMIPITVSCNLKHLVPQINSTGNLASQMFSPMIIISFRKVAAKMHAAGFLAPQGRSDHQAGNDEQVLQLPAFAGGKLA